jgi:hypothetical protein
VILKGLLCSTFAAGLVICAQQGAGVAWRHLSSQAGDFAAPNTGKEQTSDAVLDIDKDGVNDFVITERTAAPAMVWYRRTPRGWDRYIVESGALHIEAGTTYADIDGDGDLDIVAGGDYKTNEVWWWENPYPNFDPNVAWKRHTIKRSGGTQHHDLAFGDFFGDGKLELVFWNQGSHALYLAQIPPDPRNAGPWQLTGIYSYPVDHEPPQRGKAASFKSMNQHEGLAVGDVNGDGKLDVVGGGRWFENLGNGRFEAHEIDSGYAFSRAATGHLKKGGKWAQVVFVMGDGEGPLLWYEHTRNGWKSHKIADIKYGHNLQLVDFNHDGNLDLFCAEQRLNGANPDSKIYFFFGDGKGGFRPSVVATGYDSHESRVADLDGNGTLDLLIKPYNYQTPGFNILLNTGR